jgi:hypothetical protein
MRLGRGWWEGNIYDQCLALLQRHFLGTLALPHYDAREVSLIAYYISKLVIIFVILSF